MTAKQQTNLKATPGKSQHNSQAKTQASAKWGKAQPASTDKPVAVPRITKETIEKYREEVIKGGRKYSYPIISTPKKIVGLSLLVLVVALVVFIGYVSLRVYRFSDHSNFVYSVTKVIRLPAAWLGSPKLAVNYEDYLLELRRQIHYFQTQQGIDLNSDAGRELLDEYRQRALQTVIDYAYVKQLAGRYDLSVSTAEVEAELELLRQQNKLGGTDAEVEAVLQEFWGWSLADYKRSIKRELLRQKVTLALDQDAYARAESVLERLDSGDSFVDLAQEFSDDTNTAANGGEYNFWLDISQQNAHPKVLEAVFATEIGQITGIVNTGYQLEILKVLEQDAQARRRVSHISILFADIAPAIDQLKEDMPARVLINLPE